MALGVPNADSAGFLLVFLKKDGASGNDLTRMAHHVARHGEPGTVDSLVAFASSPL